MNQWWFKQINKLIPDTYNYGELEDMYDWWYFSKTVEEFSKNQKIPVDILVQKLFNTTLSYWINQTTKTGRFPHINYIQRKPETLGTEFNNLACSNSGVVLCLDIQIYNKSTYYSAHTDFNQTTSFSLHIVGIYVSSRQYFYLSSDALTYSNAKSDIFQGYHWFTNMPTLDNIKSVSYKYKGIVKTLHRNSPNTYLEETMNNFSKCIHNLMI